MRGDRARPRLAGTRFADLRWVAETASTNRDLAALAASGAPDGVVLVADHQTAGRGRLDRTWVAPAGSALLASVLLRPRLASEHVPLLTVAMALAVCAAADGQAVATRIKWPNDVVAATATATAEDAPAKLAGILAESQAGPTGDPVVVVGVGINVNWPDPRPAELVDLDRPATALSVLAGRPIDREDLLVEVLDGFGGWVARLEAEGPDGRRMLVAEAADHSATLGGRVRADLGAGSVEGVAVELDDRGDLVVRDDGGTRHVVVAGDVVHLRAAT